MMGRESRISIRSAVLFGLAALVSAGCEGAPEDDEYGPLIYDDLPATALGPFTTSVGFADGNPVEYLDMGPINTVVPRLRLSRTGSSSPFIQARAAARRARSSRSRQHDRRLSDLSRTRG